MRINITWHHIVLFFCFFSFFFLMVYCVLCFFFFFQAEDGIRGFHVTGVQTCALPILGKLSRADHGDYSVQFPIRLMNKDFGLVLETAAAAKVPMPTTAAAFQMNVAEFSEGKEEDFSAVITLMERLTGIESAAATNRLLGGNVSN